MKNTLIGCLLAPLLVLCFQACKPDGEKVNKGCVDYTVVVDGQVLKRDTCFSSPNPDSLDKMLKDFRSRQEESTRAYDTRLMIVVVDSVNQASGKVEYAMIVSEAGVLNNEVVLTNDPEIVKERSAHFPANSLHVTKVRKGETIESIVKITFVQNLRIHYRRESSGKVKD